MLVLFDDSISSISTSDIHRLLCQSTLDPWMTPRCGFCPKNIRSFFPSWRQHYSDHLATSIVSKKNKGWLKNELNNHVSQVLTGFLLGFLPDVGSLPHFGSLQYPMPFSIFQPPLPAQKETAIHPPCRKMEKLAPCQALIFSMPGICSQNDWKEQNMSLSENSIDH